MDVLLALMNVLLVMTLFSPIHGTETTAEVAESSPRRVVLQKSFSRFPSFKQIPRRDMFDPEPQFWDNNLQTIDPHIGSLMMRSNTNVINSIRRLEIKFDRILDRVDSEENCVHDVMAKLNQIHQNIRSASKNAFPMDCTSANEMPQNDLRELVAAVRYSNENIKKLETNFDMVMESDRRSMQSLEKVAETVQAINDRTIRIHDASSHRSPSVGTSYSSQDFFVGSRTPFNKNTDVESNRRGHNGIPGDSYSIDRNGNPNLAATYPNYDPNGNDVIQWNRNYPRYEDANKNFGYGGGLTSYGLNGNGIKPSTSPNYESTENVLENRNSFETSTEESIDLAHNQKDHFEKEKDHKSGFDHNKKTASPNFESNRQVPQNRNSFKSENQNIDHNRRGHVVTDKDYNGGANGNEVIQWNRNYPRYEDSNENLGYERVQTNYSSGRRDHFEKEKDFKSGFDHTKTSTTTTSPSFESNRNVLQSRNSFTAEKRQENQNFDHNRRGHVEREKNYKSSGAFNHNKTPTTSSNYKLNGKEVESNGKEVESNGKEVESTGNEVYNWNRNSHRTNEKLNRNIDDGHHRRDPTTPMTNSDFEREAIDRSEKVSEGVKKSNFESGEETGQNWSGSSSMTLNKKQENSNFSYSSSGESVTGDKTMNRNLGDEKVSKTNSDSSENSNNDDSKENIVGSTKQEAIDIEVKNRESNIADTSSTLGSNGKANQLPSSTSSTNSERNGHDSSTRKATITTTTKVKTTTNTQKTYRSVRKDTKRVTFEPDKQNCHELKVKRNGIYKFASLNELSNDADRFFYERYCDFDTDDSAWTVIQRRFAKYNQEDFNRTWLDYKLGFGKLDEEFWFGNDFIHKLSNDDDVELRIILEGNDGKEDWMQYSTFRMKSEADNYKLVIGGYSGSVSDSFLYHNDENFSTFDRRSDMFQCAEKVGNGWWFKNCIEGNSGNWLGSTSTKIMIRSKNSK